MSGVENPSAFPNGLMGSLAESPGMTLRDWFAGQCLAGPVATMVRYHLDERISFTEAQAATMAYELADALLAERAKAGAL